MYIQDFQLEGINRKEGSSIGEQLPSAITWSYKGEKHTITFPQKAIVLLLKDLENMAVIESPYDKSNKAYILSGERDIKWNLSELIKDVFPNPQNRYIYFSDVYYIENQLYFFINTGDIYDYRFSFDPKTGMIGKFITSR